MILTTDISFNVLPRETACALNCMCASGHRCIDNTFRIIDGFTTYDIYTDGSLDTLFFADPTVSSYLIYRGSSVIRKVSY